MNCCSKSYTRKWLSHIWYKNNFERKNKDTPKQEYKHYILSAGCQCHSSVMLLCPSPVMQGLQQSSPRADGHAFKNWKNMALDCFSEEKFPKFELHLYLIKR